MLIMQVIALVASFALPDHSSAAACDNGLIGLPSITAKSTTKVCHKGYIAFVDDVRKVPLWVAYRLTAQQTLGCKARSNNFHIDSSLPAGSAKPSDYAHTGYDKGHQAPAEDFAWDAERVSDSFSMANMAPQVPQLNRQQWERLEETVRSWAYAHGGDVDIFVGPVFDEHPKLVHGVAVPIGFWKVVVDANNHSLAFYMENKPISKGDVSKQLTTIDDVEHRSGVKLPVTIGDTALWPTNLKVFRQARVKACRKIMRDLAAKRRAR